MTENHLLFQEQGGGAGCSPSLKCVLGISASHVSEHRESVLLFLALAKLQVVIFSQTVFFSCCLIKDTKKLFSPPATLLQGSKGNSAVIET